MGLQTQRFSLVGGCLVRAVVGCTLAFLVAVSSMATAEVFKVTASGVAEESIAPFVNAGDQYLFEFIIDTNAAATGPEANFRALDVAGFSASFSVKGATILNDAPFLLCVGADVSNVNSIWTTTFDRLACFVGIDASAGILLEMIVPDQVTNPVGDPPLGGVSAAGIAGLTFGLLDGTGTPVGRVAANRENNGSFPVLPAVWKALG